MSATPLNASPGNATSANEKYRVLALMTGAQAGASVVQQAIGVLAPFFIIAFDINKAALGALFTSLYIGSALFTAISGVLTDRLGERTMVLISGSLMAFALVAAALVPNYAWLVGWMGVFGAGYAASTPAGGRAILGWFTRARGVAMGVRQTGVPVGGLVGALVLPAAAYAFGGYRAALLIAAAIVVVPTSLVVLLYRESDRDRPPPSSMADLGRGMRTLARDPRLVAVTITCMALVNVQLAMNGFLTVTAINVIGVSAATASIGFACAFGAAMVARLFWGWYSDRFLAGNRIGLLGTLCALAASSSVVVALLHPPLAWLFIPAAMYVGFTGAGWNGVMAAALAEIGGADRAGSALGLALTALFAASAVGPIVFGALADHTSLAVAWWETAVLALIGTLPALWLRTRRPPQTAH